MKIKRLIFVILLVSVSYGIFHIVYEMKFGPTDLGDAVIGTGTTTTQIVTKWKWSK